MGQNGGRVAIDSGDHHSHNLVQRSLPFYNECNQAIFILTSPLTFVYLRKKVLRDGKGGQRVSVLLYLLSTVRTYNSVFGGCPPWSTICRKNIKDGKEEGKDREGLGPLRLD
jgi:hypothetical protein